MEPPGELGAVRAHGETRTWCFERVLPHPRHEVWGALTEQRRLVDWFNTTITLDARVGGRVRFEFGAGDVCHGRVVELDPPTVLEYRWRFPDEETLVRWELRAIGDPRRTRLRLSHREVPPSKAAAYGAGWHAHLDQLEAHLDGVAGDPATRRLELFGPRYRELRPVYDALTSCAR